MQVFLSLFNLLSLFDDVELVYYFIAILCVIRKTGYGNRFLLDSYTKFT